MAQQTKYLQEFVHLCRARLGSNLRSIILFGSVAQKNATELSDYDFYVVVRKKITDSKRLGLMQAFTKNCDVIIRTEDEIKELLDNLSTIDLEVFAEGMLLYGENIIQQHKGHFEAIKARHHMIHHPEYGKGVWEIGLAG